LTIFGVDAVVLVLVLVLVSLLVSYQVVGGVILQFFLTDVGLIDFVVVVERVVVEQLFHINAEYSRELGGPQTHKLAPLHNFIQEFGHAQSFGFFRAVLVLEEMAGFLNEFLAVCHKYEFAVVLDKHFIVSDLTRSLLAQELLELIVLLFILDL